MAARLNIAALVSCHNHSTQSYPLENAHKFPKSCQVYGVVYKHRCSRYRVDSETAWFVSIRNSFKNLLVRQTQVCRVARCIQQKIRQDNNFLIFLKITSFHALGPTYFIQFSVLFVKKRVKNDYCWMNYVWNRCKHRISKIVFQANM